MKSLILRTFLVLIIGSLSHTVLAQQKSNKGSRRPTSKRHSQRAPKSPLSSEEVEAITIPCYRSIGTIISGLALSLGLPEYPEEAKTEGPTDTVVVRVYVNEKGRVIAAKAIKGHPLLQGSAVKTARTAIFPPFKVEGKPIKCTGVVTYSFVGKQ